MSILESIRAAKRSSVRIGVIAAATVTTVSGLTGCAGSASEHGATGACTSPGVTADSITVASVSPLSGPSASTFAGFVEGARARFEVENEAGGVNGRKIKLVTNDDLGDGAAQVTAARNAVQSQKAFGILHASRADTMFDYLSSQNVPVTGFPGQIAYQTKENAFGFAGSASIGFPSTAQSQFFVDRGVTKLGVLANNSTGSKGAAEGLIKVAPTVGLNVEATALDIPVGSFDATSIALQMKNAGVDGLFMPLVTDSSVAIFKAVKAQGLELKAAYMQGLYDPKVTDQVGDLLEGVSSPPVGTIPVEVAGDATEQLAVAMKKYGDGVDPRTGFTTPGYVAADLFIEGLKMAGECPTRENFVKELRAVDAYDGGGLLVEPANFAEGPVVGGFPYGRCAWFVTYSGGAFVPDTAATCGEILGL
ncbi:MULTISPECIES: ABC transporter substrate-binding protein [unclassified Rhodococcus (in: high G+C Gram-positive bacteria)]|uniref:ABC transporter substrate-binding protein n=1 Tax=unclassified Rhodococcus (in: high G+C Gram-positive bacteria) TaxID=192944 RepID=UPI000A50BAAE|nr:MULTISPECIES: ABC transporter substrate-binding protein [unclassified Rhodococcus (in: high G+C Gram-positive bacteria)]